ncbi:MAG TPA: hydrogenase, partial [Edaphobacter sp.]|nr:hydrogenase [Edaphobacter sp.]
MKQIPEQHTPLRERLLPGQAPVLGEGHSFGTITDKIVSIVLRRPVTLGWVGGLLIAMGFLNVLTFAIIYLLYRGVGIWGLMIPVAWGFAIINFVWWIGIG